MENKTAVEWLHNTWGNHPDLWTWEKIQEWFEQAKEMEKQQFVDFFMWFRDNGERYLGLSIEQFVEEFYNQKFK